MSEALERRTRRRRFHVARWAVLLVVLAVSTVIGLLHQKAPDLRLVGVDALCPFGGVESLWALLASGGMLNKIAVGSFVLLVAAAVLNLLFGRVFCGQFCPLGTLQELLGSLRAKIGISRRTLPAALDVPARFLKYLVFGAFAWLSWLTGSLLIRPYDPWVAYHHLTSSELLTNFSIGTAVLGVSLAGSFVYDRFFCKYLCPTGAVLGLFNKFSAFRITRHADACIDCGACDKACPVNIAVATVESAVSDSECIACGECVVACPASEALKVESRRGTVLRPLVLVGASAAIMVGIVGVSVVSGQMSFFSRPLAAQVLGEAQAEQVGTASAVTPTQTAPTPAFDTSLIKGYMTMAEVSQASGIPAEEFITAFGVSEAELSAPLKEMKYAHDFDTQAVRDFVADRMGVVRSTPDGCE